MKKGQPGRADPFLGGEGGIRTHGDRKATVLFESTPIVHSGTSPKKNYEVRMMNYEFCWRKI